MRSESWLLSRGFVVTFSIRSKDVWSNYQNRQVGQKALATGVMSRVTMLALLPGGYFKLVDENKLHSHYLYSTSMSAQRVTSYF